MPIASVWVNDSLSMSRRDIPVFLTIGLFAA